MCLLLRTRFLIIVICFATVIGTIVVFSSLRGASTSGVLWVNGCNSGPLVEECGGQGAGDMMGHKMFDIAILNMTNELNQKLVISGLKIQANSGMRIWQLYVPERNHVLGRVGGEVSFPLVRRSDERHRIDKGFTIPPHAFFTVVVTLQIATGSTGGAVRGFTLSYRTLGTDSKWISSYESPYWGCINTLPASVSACQRDKEYVDGWSQL